MRAIDSITKRDRDLEVTERGLRIDSTGGGFGAVGPIYRQGGVAGGRIYTSLSAAGAAAQQMGPGTPVYIDASLGSPVGEAVQYDFDGLAIVGLGGATPTLTMPEGASFLFSTYKSLGIRNLNLAWDGDTAPIQVEDFLVLSLEDYASLTTTADATAAMIFNGSGDLYIDVGYACQIVGDAAPVIELDTGGGAICELNLKATLPDVEGSIIHSLGEDSITGGDSGAFTVTDTTDGLTAGGGAANISHTQTGATAVTYRP